MEYDSTKFDRYWIEYWHKKRVFRLQNDRLKPKCFFYHFPICGTMDHVECYSLVYQDILARVYRKYGYNVLFGLTKENPLSDQVLDFLGIGYDASYSLLDSKVDELSKEIYQKIEKSPFSNPEIGVYNVSSQMDEFVKKEKDSFFPNKDIPALEKKDGMLFYLPLANHFMTLEGFLPQYEYIFGLSYMLINPKWKDYREIVSEEEKDYFEEYLSVENPVMEFVFTGEYCIHPFTQKEIPILFTKNMNLPAVSFGIPTLSNKAKRIANQFGFDTTIVLQSSFLIHSDFCDGLSLEEARLEISKKAEEKEAGKRIYGYEQEVLSLQEIKSKGYCDDLCAFSLEFSKKENGYSFLHEEDTISQFHSHNVIVFPETDLERYFMLKKLMISFPQLYSMIDEVHCISREHEFYDIDQIKKDCIDARRLKILMPNISLESIYQFLNLIWKCGFYRVESAEECEKSYQKLVERAPILYEKMAIENLLYLMNLFINDVFRYKKISDLQLLGFLKICNPLFPVLTEELYRELFNGSDTISFEEFPYKKALE